MARPCKPSQSLWVRSILICQDPGRRCSPTMYGSSKLPASSSRCDCPANIQSTRRWDLAAATLKVMFE